MAGNTVLQEQQGHRGSHSHFQRMRTYKIDSRLELDEGIILNRVTHTRLPYPPTHQRTLSKSERQGHSRYLLETWWLLSGPSPFKQVVTDKHIWDKWRRLTLPRQTGSLRGHPPVSEMDNFRSYPDLLNANPAELLINDGRLRAASCSVSTWFVAYNGSLYLSWSRPWSRTLRSLSQGHSGHNKSIRR